MDRTIILIGVLSGLVGGIVSSIITDGLADNLLLGFLFGGSVAFLTYSALAIAVILNRRKEESYK